MPSTPQAWIETTRTLGRAFDLSPPATALLAFGLRNGYPCNAGERACAELVTHGLAVRRRDRIAFDPARLHRRAAQLEEGGAA